MFWRKENSVEQVIKSDNLETIRTKRGQLVAEQEAINDEIKLLDERIKTLDTTKHVPLITTFKAQAEVF
ncbi:hypothetical protein [Cyclobacterium qasimii]|uniref:Uncharacterized protein n=1 Tax=Cyclobacterium qasimii M12-11B TaxID=641524 RepID=S7WUH9_9BACT|nr:hypothetical protein [Cyclobacterium qasimii]EPR67713.1 hypothetical protein ADICYQ_3268 [Cyclobacterium qasimii M12-11B]